MNRKGIEMKKDDENVDGSGSDSGDSDEGEESDIEKHLGEPLQSGDYIKNMQMNEGKDFQFKDDFENTKWSKTT